MKKRGAAVLGACAKFSWLLVGLAACSSDLASQLVDETHPLQPNIPAAPIAPAAPAALALTPCPLGWREVPAPAAGSAVTCDPWPAAGPQTCGEDSAHFPGTPGCSVVGAACPAGEWPEGLPASAPILYVRPGAGSGGTGSQAAPFGSVSAALLAATRGTILALGKGRFDETIRLPAGITLWGACVAQTNIATTVAGSGASIQVLGDGAVIRNLHLGASRPGIWIHVGSNVELRDVVISGAVIAGLLADNAVKVTGSRIVIRATQPRAGFDDVGQGIEVLEGAQVELTGLVVEASHYYGVLAHGAGTLLKLSDAVIRDTQSERLSGLFGQGLSVALQGRIEGQRLSLERNATAGINVETGGRLSLSDAVIRDSQPCTNDPNSGYGGFFSTGGAAELRRVFLHRNRSNGLRVQNMGTVLDAADVVVRGTLETLTKKDQGNGIVGSTGAQVKAARVSLENNKGVGLSGQGLNTVIEATDLTVRHTDGNAINGFDGLGASALDSAQLTITRALFDENQCVSIAATAGARLALFDVRVQNTRGCLRDGLSGYGLEVQFGATATANRILFEKNRSGAIVASEAGTLLTLTDVVARDTTGVQAAGNSYSDYGEGLHAQREARVELSRALIERNQETGVLVTYGAHITGTDVVVRGTLPALCPAARCQASAGIGALASYGGGLVLSTFSITQNAQLGLQLAEGGTADLRAGEISDNPIGVNVQTVNFDLVRIQSEVIFRGNQVTVNSELLPLPKSTQSLH